MLEDGIRKQLVGQLAFALQSILVFTTGLFDQPLFFGGAFSLRHTEAQYITRLDEHKGDDKRRRKGGRWVINLCSILRESYDIQVIFHFWKLEASMM